MNIGDNSLRVGLVSNNHDEDSFHDEQLEVRERSSSFREPIEHNKFHQAVFFEFFVYFLLNAFLGPLAYILVLQRVSYGKVLARNLQIYGGRRQVFNLVIWLLRVFAYVTTFVLNDTNPHMDGSLSQFWLLIYTDISLAVLQAGYYSSFTDSQIIRLKTEPYETEDNIFDRIVKVVMEGKSKMLQRGAVYKLFPEIDPANFYLVFPAKTTTSRQLEQVKTNFDAMPIAEAMPWFQTTNSGGSKDALAVHGEAYAEYIADKGGYQQLGGRIRLIKGISRFIVFIRLVLPVINNIYEIFSQPHTFDIGLILYLIQQLVYSYLIYRIVAVYDVLFLGLLLYYKKYVVTSWLIKAVKFDPHNVAEAQQGDNKKGNNKDDMVKIPVNIPENTQTWLHIMRILTSLNEQAFTIIDVNMSFVLLYTILFFVLYFVQQVGFLQGLFGSTQEFLEDNPSLLVVIIITILVVSIVLVVDVILGVLINLQFEDQAQDWMLHKYVISSITTKYRLYTTEMEAKQQQQQPPPANEPTSTTIAAPADSYYKVIQEIKDFLGDDYRDKLHDYVRRLRNMMTLVLDGIDNEAKYHPHTLLGITTTIPTAVAIFTVITALGLTNVAQIFNYFAKNVTVEPPEAPGFL